MYSPKALEELLTPEEFKIVVTQANLVAETMSNSSKMESFSVNELTYSAFAMGAGCGFAIGIIRRGTPAEKANIIEKLQETE